MLAILGFLLLFFIPLAVGVPLACNTKHAGGKHGQSSNATLPSSSLKSNPTLSSVSTQTTDGAQAEISSSAISSAIGDFQAEASSLVPSASASASASGSSSTSTAGFAQGSGSIWQPAAGTAWQIMLSQVPKVENGKVTPDVPVYDIDLFDASAQTISDLKAAGKKVICYFSAGTYEGWRPDNTQFSKADLGKALPAWENENWLKVDSASVRTIMAARIKMAADKGCDAIDPDNVDGYDNDNGLGLTDDTNADYVNWLAAEAAKYKMATGLKNAAALIPKVLSSVQFSVNEQCAELKECSSFDAFIKAGKPVFNIEYPSNAPQLSDAKSSCDTTGQAGFSTVIKNMDLDAFVRFCDGTTATTAT